MIPADIFSDALLLVEGRDEENFFRALLAYLRLSPVDVVDVAGKTNFARNLRGIVRLPGFSRVATCAVVRDADDDPKAAFRSVQGALGKNSLPTPGDPAKYTRDTTPHVGIFILPGPGETGMLEDLCLRTVKSHPMMPCTNEYMECISAVASGASDAVSPTNESKARVQAFLAAMPDATLSVGVAAQKGYWDFEDAGLDAIKQFLHELRG